MYALCVSGAVNTQGFVWKFLITRMTPALYKNCHSFIHTVLVVACRPTPNDRQTLLWTLQRLSETAILLPIPNKPYGFSGRKARRYCRFSLTMLLYVHRSEVAY